MTEACASPNLDKQIAYLKHYELFRSNLYSDVGHLAIGYGHNVTAIDNLTIPLSKEQAEELLKQDIANNTKLVNSVVKVDLLDHQRDALVLLVFNWRIGKFKKSKLLKYLNNKEFLKAAHEFLDIIHVKGKVNKILEERRVIEQNIFLFGWDGGL